jgi:hypothetical protein
MRCEQGSGSLVHSADLSSQIFMTHLPKARTIPAQAHR